MCSSMRVVGTIDTSGDSAVPDAGSARDLSNSFVASVDMYSIDSCPLSPAAIFALRRSLARHARFSGRELGDVSPDRLTPVGRPLFV